MKRQPKVKITVDAINALRDVGAQMSNVCFNIGQHANDPAESHRSLNARQLRILLQLYRQWDEANAVVHGQMKRSFAQQKRKAGA